MFLTAVGEGNDESTSGQPSTHQAHVIVVQVPLDPRNCRERVMDVHSHLVFLHRCELVIDVQLLKLVHQPTQII